MIWDESLFKSTHGAAANGADRKIAVFVRCVVIMVAVVCFGIRESHGAILVVGGACGATIQACIDTAIAGDTVEIPAGNYNESLSLNKAVSLVGQGATPAGTVISALNLNDRVLLIDGASIDAGVLIENLTFRDGVITSSILIFRDGGGILVIGGAQPTIQHVVIRNNSVFFDGGGLTADVGSPLALLDVTFLDNTSRRAGGGAAFRDEATITDSLFQGNESTDNVGGAIRAAGNTIIRGSIFRNNVTRAAAGIGHGGAVYAFGIDVTIEGSLFEDNHCMESDCDGGAVYVAATFTTPTLTLTDTDFLDNTAGRNGGGVHASVDVVLTRGSFQRNHAPGSGTSFADGGGGLSVRHCLTADGTLFASNTTEKHGGAVFVHLGPTSLANCCFDSNSANDGGGFATSSVEPTMIGNTDFTGNTAEEDGGGLWTQTDGATIQGGRFEGNTATTGNGGGAFIQTGNLDADGVTFTGNNAGDSGGGAFVASGNALLVGGLFEGNGAAGSNFFFGGGGGIIVASGDLIADGTVFSSNTTPDGNGGGALVAGATDVQNVRFESNEARSGGGVDSRGALTIADSVFADNVAHEAAGGGV